MKLIVKVVTDGYADTNKWFEVGNLSEFNAETIYNTLFKLLVQSNEYQGGRIEKQESAYEMDRKIELNTQYGIIGRF